MQIWKFIFNSAIKPDHLKAMDDPTLYRVVTPTDSYCGRITYQDNAIIWMKVADKPIKILKANIARINIL